jgi:O-antigen/teichoic acid export membrane protein
MSLRRKTQLGVFWSAIERIGDQGTAFLVQLVLMRLLFPSDFGTIAVVSVFLLLAQTFIDSGLGAALVQKKEVSRIDVSSIFTFNLIVSVVAVMMMWLAAPWMATFYGMPLLRQVVPVLSLTLIINAFAITQNHLLARELRFKTLALISIPSALLAGVVGIAMALLQSGIWSLVGHRIAHRLLRTVLLWMTSSMRPRLGLSLASLRAMIPFGSGLLASEVVRQIFDNLYTLVIGRFYSAADLGFYSRANAFQYTPTTLLCGIANRVLFPVFSSIQDQNERLRLAMRTVMPTVAFVVLPFMTFLVVAGRPLVLIVFTDKWLPCVPYLQVLAFIGMLYPMHTINLNILRSKGRSDLIFGLGIVKNGLRVVSVLLTYSLGISAMIIGELIVSLVSTAINAYCTGLFIAYPVRKQLADILPNVGVSALSGGAAYLVGHFWTGSDPWLLACQSTVLVSTYVFLSWLLRLPAFKQCAQMLGDYVAMSRQAVSS